MWPSAEGPERSLSHRDNMLHHRGVGGQGKACKQKLQEDLQHASPSQSSTEFILMSYLSPWTQAGFEVATSRYHIVQHVAKNLNDLPGSQKLKADLLFCKTLPPVETLPGNEGGHWRFRKLTASSPFTGDVPSMKASAWLAPVHRLSTEPW